jgi:hypothetical protein
MRIVLLLSVTLLLGACGGSPTRHEPPALHSAWIAALRANDRQAAQRLLADDATISIDQALAQAQYLVTLNSPQTGHLQAVDLLPPTTQGAGQEATSLWRLDLFTSCFRASMAQTNAGWRITNWAEYRTDCPPTGGS